MPDSSADRDPLDRLAEEFVGCYRAGQRPPLSEFVRRLPDRADEIRDLFPALVEMEQLKPVSGELTGEFAGAPEPTDPLRVGEFRILRRVGHGGMGVVYEAVQESLGRHVALKLMPLDALADPRRLERFRREAKAAARLHHTNIVPVFGTGEADGRHFYAMQFIDGHPLDAVIDEVRRMKDKSAPTLPRAVSEVAAAMMTGHFAASRECERPESEELQSLTLPAHPPSSPPLSGSLSDGGRHYWETVARLGAQAGDALAYAHTQGLLHRDIKPANLLLDLRGTLWVTDFGLAKATDADDLTHSGDVVGTLRYLAPERFDGPGDHRSDVYALGLTLYELLTLRPAFAAEKRAKLVEQVLAASPAKPRHFNAAIPRDLETVVLKAIARDPAMRYQSAAELAEDLRRFLQDRPIQARRASGVEMAWRWCRRNPVVAGLMAAVALVTAGGFAATTYQAAVAREEARRADDNAAHAEARADEVLREKQAQENLNKQLRANQEHLRQTLYSAHMNQVQSAWQGENYTRVLDLLEQHRPRGDEPDLRGFEWHYWKKQAHGEVAVFRLPTSGAVAVPREATTTNILLALSDDGARVASHTASQGLQVWDVATGRRLTHHPKLRPSPWSGSGRGARGSLDRNNLLFSPDGRRVAVVVPREEVEDEEGMVRPRAGRIFFVEVETGRDLYAIDLNVRETQRFSSMMMDFSPDGNLFAVVTASTSARGEEAKTDPATIAVHDLTAKKPLFPPVSRPNLALLSQVEFQPDGRRLAVRGQILNENRTSTPQFVLLDAATGGVLPDTPADRDPVSRRRTADGRWSVTLNINSDRQRGVIQSPTITVKEDGKELWKGPVPTRTTNFRFSPDRKYLVGYSSSEFGSRANSAVRVWNAATGEVLPVHIVLSDPLVAVAFRPDGKLVTLDAGAAKTWDLTPPPLVPMTLTTGFSFPLRQASVTPDGRYCVSGIGGSPFGRNPGEKDDEPERALLVLAEPGRELLRVPMKDARSQSGILPSTALSADGSVLAIGRDNVARPQEKAAEVPPLITLWDVANKSEIGSIASPAKANEGRLGGGRVFTQPTLSRDGRLVALVVARARADPVPSTVTVWDVATRQPRYHIDVKTGVAFALAFSPDGRRLAVAVQRGPTSIFENSFVLVFDLASGSEVRKFDVPFSTTNLQYSPDGKWLAVYPSIGMGRGRGRGSSPQLWLAEGGKEPIELTGSATMVRDLAFSPDSRRVALLSTHQGGRSEVKLWDSRTGRELLSLPLDLQGNAVRFSANGQALHVFNVNGRLTFDATSLSPEAEASDVVDRLSPAETREQILAELDRLSLSKELKARVAELARPVRSVRPRTTGPAIVSLLAGQTESEYKALLGRYEERVKSDPKSSIAWSYLGGARYRLGKFDEALVALEKAEEVTTEARRARLSSVGVCSIAILAMTQHRLGRAGEAKKTLAKAREAAKGIPFSPVTNLLDEAEALIEPKK